MKKIIAIALLSVFTFSSCSDDDSSTEEPIAKVPEIADPIVEDPIVEDPSISSELIGKWRLDYYTPVDYGNGLESIEECEKESIYEYTVDGKYIYEYVLDIGPFTGDGSQMICTVDGNGTTNYSVDGNKITNIDEDGITTETTYSITDEKLTVTYVNGDIDIYIKTTDPFFSEL